jgi:zinc protease
MWAAGRNNLGGARLPAARAHIAPAPASASAPAPAPASASASASASAPGPGHSPSRPPPPSYPAAFSALPALPPEATERTFIPPTVGQRVLASGAPLWVIENHDLPLATVVVVMPGAGATADPIGRAGLADFTAELITEGAGRLGAQALSERIEGLGSHLSSWAEEDAAFVRVSMLTAHQKATIEALGWVVTAPRLEVADARRVHEDRVTAVQLRRDQPGAVAHLLLGGALQGPHAPYGHPPLGYAADLERYGGAEARTFYSARWSPDRMIVIAVGDVDPDELRADLDAALGPWHPTPARARPDPAAPRTVPVLGGRLVVVDRVGAGQSNVLIGAVGLPRRNERSFRLEVLATALGGTFTSRLSHRLREELGYTYGAAAAAGYLRATGVVAIETAVFTPVTGAAIAEIRRIVADLGGAPLAPEELAAAQQNLVRGLPQAFATNAQTADSFAGIALNGLPPDWFTGYAAHIRAVTAEDVRALAAELLAPERLVTIVVGPRAQIANDLAKLGLGKPIAADPDGNLQRPAVH